MNHAAEMIERSMPGLRTWIGRREVVEDEISLTTVERIAAGLAPGERNVLPRPVGPASDAASQAFELGQPLVFRCSAITCNAHRMHPGRLTGFAARLTRPLWVGEPPTVCGAAPCDGRMAGWGVDKEGYHCAAVELECAA